MTEGKKIKIKKVVSVSLNVLMYVFLALCIFLLAVSVTSKKSADGATRIFGREMRLVVSDSMAKCDETYDTIKQYKIKAIPLRSMVFVECVPENETEANAWYSKLKKGDVLTFRYSYGTQLTITHRIVSIDKNANGGYTIVLEGDNRAPKTDDGKKTTVGQQTIHTEERSYSSNYVIGKVTGQSKLLGLMVYAVKHPVGIALIVIVPCLIIMVLEIIKVVGVFNEEKRRKAAEVQERQTNEIEELRRQLASLQAGMANATAPTTAETTENTAQPSEVVPEQPVQEQAVEIAQVESESVSAVETSEQTQTPTEEEKPLDKQTEEQTATETAEKPKEE